jgi:hypothetical protein
LTAAERKRLLAGRQTHEEAGFLWNTCIVHMRYRTGAGFRVRCIEMNLPP